LARLLFWGTAGVAISTISATLGAGAALFMPLDPAVVPLLHEEAGSQWWRNGLQYRLQQPLTVLVLGVEPSPGIPLGAPEALNGHADAIWLVRFDPQDDTTTVLSLPRDTRVLFPSGAVGALHEADTIGGTALVQQSVSTTLGGLRIDRTVRLNPEGLREVVDLLGGVELLVAQPMRYRDRAGNLTIQLDNGWQSLDGDRVEQFARYRVDSPWGDLDRVQRLQILLLALRDRALSPGMLPQLSQIAQRAHKYLRTNLSREEVIAIVNLLSKQDPDHMHLLLLPGKMDQNNFWNPESKALARLLETYFPPDRPGLSRRTKLMSSSARDRYDQTYSRISVQDATGNPAAVEQAIAQLRQAGFVQVRAIDPWPYRERHTQIVAQSGDLNLAELVQRRLGRGEIVRAATGDLGSDLTIRLGSDSLEP
jgi:LCP family protein required for cell wall assembly